MRTTAKSSFERDMRALVHFLLIRRRFGPGSRVLCCHTLDQGLVEKLAWFGLHVARTDEIDGCDDHPFDLVLMSRSGSPTHSDLGSPASLQETARLLACLRPGGTLTIAELPGNNDRPTHSVRCWMEHLERFPGCTLARLQHSNRGPKLRDGVAVLPMSGPLAVTLQIPDVTHARPQWLSFTGQGVELPQRDAEAAMRRSA